MHDLEVDYVSHHQTDFTVMSWSSFACGSPAFAGGTRCLDDTGNWCFDDFGSDRQPESPDHINTSFDLFTSDSSSTKITLSSDLDKVLSGVDATLPWKIVVHGWRMSGQSTSMLALKSTFFSTMGKVNVIIVDWKNGADNFPNYCQSAANTRLVGKTIGMLVRKLENHFNTNIAERTHIIGFSLGGHVAGNAGMYLRRNPSQFKPTSNCDKLYRITGLDAAGPAFEGMDPRLRLDSTDACYVDAIHTDDDYLGIKMAVAHDDFYPNGGEDQPGCELLGNRVLSRFIAGLDVGCDHFRSIEYFMESLLEDKIFSAFQCDNFDDFKNGMCLSSSRQENMGYDWKEQNSIQGRRDFTVTRKEDPFSGKQAKITIAFAQSTEGCGGWFDGKDYNGHGTVYVTLIGSDGSQSERIEMGSNQHLPPTTTFTAVAALPLNMEVETAKVSYDKSWHEFDDWCVSYKIDVSDGTTTKSASTKADNILSEVEQILSFEN